MLQKLLVWLAWMYWHTNRPFVAAFAEAVFGYGEGDLKVNGRDVARKLNHYLHQIQPQVFLQFIGTLALLPLCQAKVFPRSPLGRAPSKQCNEIQGFFPHVQFFSPSKTKA